MKYSLCPYCGTWFETTVCAIHLNQCGHAQGDFKNYNIEKLKTRTAMLGGVLQTDDEKLTKQTEDFIQAKEEGKL